MRSRSKPKRALMATMHANGSGRSPQRVTWAPTAAAGRPWVAAHCMRTRVTGSVLSDSHRSWNQRSVPRSLRPPPLAHSISSTSGQRSATCRHDVPPGVLAVDPQVALAVGGEGGGAGLGDAPVGIPLEVGDAGVGVEDPGDGVEHEALHLRAEDVEHELLALLPVPAARLADHPVGVLAQQGRAGVGHLGLDPEAEAQAALLGGPA